MAKASPAIESFNGGELSPRLEGRTSLDKYASGCRTLDNFLPLVQGGALKRSGLRYVHEVKTTASISISIAAEWSEDVLSDGTEFPADGSDDGVGVVNIGGNKALRCVQRYPLDDLPAGVTLSQIQVRNNVKVVTNVAAATWIYGRYGAIGQDAEADAGATAFTRADASQVSYLTGDTAFRTTGSKTVDITSAQVKTDLAACKAAGVPFSLAIRETSESLAGVHNVALSEYIEGANAPTLILTYTETRARLIPFEFNTEQAYSLLFGQQYMRVFKDGGIVLEDPKAITGTTNATPVVVTSNAHGYNNNDEVLIQGTGIAALDNHYWIVANKTANTYELLGSTAPGATATLGTASRVYEIATPYAATDVDAIAYAQSADVMYLVHPDYAPRKLSRTGHTSWTLTTIPFDWQPFSPENIDLTSYVVASSDTGTVTLTSSSGIFTSAHVGSYFRLREVIEANHAEWKAGHVYDFDSATNPGSRGFFSASTPQVGDRLYFDGKVYELIDKHGATGKLGYQPPIHEDGQATDGRVDFQFVNYGAGYVLITAFTSAFRVTATVTKTLPDSVVAADQSITAFNSLNPIQLTINAHGFETGDKVFITGVSSTRGTALNNQTWTVTRVDANNFTVPTSGVGLAGSGGTATQVYWASNVNGANAAIFPNGTKWSFGAFSDARGYPRAITFFEERLWLAGTDSNPDTFWASRTGLYEDFRETSADDSAIVATLSSRKVQAIQWMVGQDLLILGTSGGEWALQGTDNEPVNPDNARAKQRSTFGSREAVLPVDAEGPVLFVEKSGRQLRELTFDFDSGKFLGPDMTVLADHITLGLVKQMAFQAAPNRVLWVILEDGSLRGFTYERAQQVTAWHRHTVGGTSAAVESICVIPHPDGDQDQLWAVVRRSINGTPRRYVEVLDPEWLRTMALVDAFYLDSGLTYDGTPVSTVAGLDHLIGETVYALIDGFAAGPYTVAAGGTVALGTTGSTVHVGLLYQASLETMRLEAGAQDGTAQGKTKRITTVVLRLDQAGEGLAFGPNLAASTEDATLARGTLTDGDSERKPWPGGYEKEGRIFLRHALPTPCTVTAIYPSLVTQDGG